MGMDWEHKDHIEAYNSVFLKKLAMKHDCAFVDLYMLLFDENTGESMRNTRWTGNILHMMDISY